VMLEPGRWIAGPPGLLLASVILQKQGADRRFLVLDAAMNDLVRPAMYEAWHGILPVGQVDFVAPVSPADVVGPVCETGDTFARGRALPSMGPGALVAFLDAGAYGAAMSSTYNMRPLAAEVLVDGTRFAVTRDRQSYEALLAGNRIPAWLGEASP
jgi:diaminopimelate decarboxylase